MKRLELFNGKYTMPRIIDMQSKDTKAYREIQKMYDAMWNAYLVKGTKGSISLPYWAQRIKSPKLMNIALSLLSDNGYIEVSTQPNRNWSEARLNESKILSYVTDKELASIRKHFKWSKYVLSNTEVDKKDAKLTKINGNIKDTGLYRKGFTKASKTQFQFDIPMMTRFYDEIVELVNYGINKTLDKYPELRDDMSNYGEIGKEVVDTYINIDGTYNSGSRKSDSRGRNIQGYLNKIGNPVGYKIMRSLLVITEENRQVATTKGLRAKYLFIAELAGYKVGTIEGKIEFGKECFHNKIFPEIDDVSDIPEHIWLIRLYKDVQGYIDAFKAGEEYKWSVPIEIDMSASVLGFYGILLGHRPYMDRCNMIGTNLNDAWGHSVIKNRIQYKSAVMRRLYGSMQSPKDMWIDMNISYNPDDNTQVLKDLTTGEMSIANEFKDFMINNAQMKPTMKLNIYGEKFIVECNKFFNQGEKTIRYDLFDSRTNSIRRINHTDTIKVPNLQAFRRYVATALIHHLDSRVMDTTCNVVYDEAEWCLDIHDAIIVDCEYADLARETYAKELEKIYLNRKDILQNYFRSINILASAIQEWKEVQAKVEPMDSEFKCSPMVLK